jgi:peroxiredoxin
MVAALIVAGCLSPLGAQGQATPKVGDKARDFTLQGLDGATVRLSEQFARGSVVLVVLRGYPGYQCPFCTRQFGDYLTNASKFEAANARVLFVYPGQADGLREHAATLTTHAPLPIAFRILPDPDYTFTLAYGLRWEAPQETAYPSTFVFDRTGVVTFAETSRSHGDRVTAASVLMAKAPDLLAEPPTIEAVEILAAKLASPSTQETDRGLS